MKRFYVLREKQKERKTLKNFEIQKPIKYFAGVNTSRNLMLTMMSMI